MKSKNMKIKCFIIMMLLELKLNISIDILISHFIKGEGLKKDYDSTADLI